MKHSIADLARATLAWRRVLQLIWQTQPWFIAGLIILTVLSGLVPSAQIQLTSTIVGSAAQAMRFGRPQNLINMALLFGALQGALLLFASLLGLITQHLQTLLMLRLNASKLIMRRGFVAA